MLVSRSSLENPSPFDRFIRTSSPSRISTRCWRLRSSWATRLARVDLPAPESPVNQRVNPSVIWMRSAPVEIDYLSSHPSYLNPMLQTRIPANAGVAPLNLPILGYFCRRLHTHRPPSSSRTRRTADQSIETSAGEENTFTAPFESSASVTASEPAIPKNGIPASVAAAQSPTVSPT